MAEESGFFTGVAGDRKYTAQFMNEKLHEAMQRANGIVPRIDQELAVTSDGSLTIVLGTGTALKGGVFYRNTAPRDFTLDSPTLGMKRYDRIVIRLDRYQRKMEAIVLKGEEALEPVAPEYIEDDDIAVLEILVDHTAAPIVITLVDERQMRPLFITDQDSIDCLKEGQTYGRLLKAKADALNAGQTGVSLRKFIFTSRLTINFLDMYCGLHYSGNLLIGHSGSKQFSYSLDDGITIEQPENIAASYTICSLANYATCFFAGSGGDGKIYKSYSPDSSWTLIYTSGFSEYIQALCALSSTLLIATSSTGGRVYKTEDGGTTWTTNTIETSLKNLESLGGSVILGRGANGKIYRSTDAGSTWTVAATPVFSENFSFFKHLGEGIVVAGYDDGAVVFRSTDYGFTWDAGITLEDGEKCSALLVDDAKTYLACESTIYESLDKGATWTKKWTLPRVGSIVFLYKNSVDIIVAITETGYICWGYPFEA